MSQTTPNAVASGPLGRLNDMVAVIRESNAGLAIGVVIILAVLILPMPPVLLDVLLAFSIVFSVMSLIVFVKHRANIGRLMAGTESRIGAKG